MSNLLAARAQMAMSLGFHIVFAEIGIALPAMMVLAEWQGHRTGNAKYLELAKRWSKGVAILFAVGAVSGTVLSFELLRGSAFVFRRYGSRSGEARRRWGLIFAIASTISPLLLGVIIGAVATGVVGAAQSRVGVAPFMREGLLAAPGSVALLAGTGAVALAAVVALRRRSFAFARVAVAAEVSLILWGWAAAQYPYVVPPSVTIRAAAAPQSTLEFLLWALAGGAAILIPSLAYLLRTFTARERQ